MKTLYIIGRGIDPSAHLTIEGIQALQKSEVVYGIEPEKQTWIELAAKYDIPEVTDITQLYRCGSEDQKNYSNFIDFIKEKFHTKSNIALLIAGHPRLGVTFAQTINKKIGNDIKIKFIANVSSFDIMINDLSLDPLEQGSCLVDANRLLLFNYHLETSINYFVYHICSVGTKRLNFDDSLKDNQLSLLRDYFLKFYSHNKIVYFCKAANGPNEQGCYTPVVLSELIDKASIINFGTSLYIPAENPKSFNRDFFNLLN